MRTILTHTSPYPEKYINYFKWTIVGCALVLDMSIAIGNGIWYSHAFKNDPDSTFNFGKSDRVSRAIYYAIMTIDILIAILFCYTVVRVWHMLSSKRYGFMVKKNVPSMVTKLVFNVLNLATFIMVMVKFNDFLGGFLRGGTDSLNKVNEKFASTLRVNLAKESCLLVSQLLTSAYIWWLVGLEAE